MLALTPEQTLQAALGHHRAGRLAEAETGYRTLLSRQPAHADASHLLGLIAIETGREAEAVVLIEKAVALQPGEPMYHANLGVAYRRLGRGDEAIASLRRAIALSPHFANAHGGLGHALLDRGRPDEAITALRRAIELSEDYPEAHARLADAYVRTGQFAAAIPHYQKAIALCPSDASTRSNFALLLLRLGRYREGWQEYEWRLGVAASRRDFSVPRWNGEAAPGQTILIHAEQGFGDTIHFLRYLPLVRSRSGATRVIFQCQPELVSLVRQSGDWDAEISSAQSITPSCDLHLPLLSLPLVIGRFDPLPMSQPYLRADSAHRAAWRDRLGPKASIRVGVAWAGSATHREDARRSIAPGALRPLLSIPGLSFYSLQIPRATAELIDLTEHVSDFADTAALLTELDLIISVDTAVAHLAGALGRPVWTLLSAAPDWRWGVEGETTPWYPTMRLFRQRTAGDWDEVIGRVGDELRAMATAD